MRGTTAVEVARRVDMRPEARGLCLFTGCLGHIDTVLKGSHMFSGGAANFINTADTRKKVPR